jgi:predicted nuclease with TOPRIM domain
VKKGRDIEMEEKMEEFQDHIRDLEKQNVQLKEKVRSEEDEGNVTASTLIMNSHSDNTHNEFTQ